MIDVSLYGINSFSLCECTVSNKSSSIGNIFYRTKQHITLSGTFFIPQYFADPISTQFLLQEAYNVATFNIILKSTLQTHIQNSYMIARLRITYKLENTENFEGLKTYTLDFICACTEKGIYVCIR